MSSPNNIHPIITWPLFEPASKQAIRLTEDELVQHVLLVGSTGSGKSTLLISAIQQLVAQQADSPSAKIGLLLLDAKGDDLVFRIQEAAARAGRSSDVIIFGPQGNRVLDLFGNLRSLTDVERVVRLVMLGIDKFGGDNSYWHQSTEAMLSAAFTLLVAGGKTPAFPKITEFLRQWFLSPNTPPKLLQRVDEILKREGSKIHPQVAMAVDQVRLWATLDQRTKSNLQSCMVNTLRPLFSPAAASCFHAEGKIADSPVKAVHEGAICIVTVNALAEPDLARFLFRLARQFFYDAGQQRLPGNHRLCGMVADEFPLVAVPDDDAQLATIRSKKIFLLAACQSLRSIGERVGPGRAMSMLNNFNTNIFLRSREAETSVHALLALGNRKEIRRLKRGESDGGNLGTLPSGGREEIEVEVPVCPVGALGQLAPHQAYVVFADGSRTETPVWFAPWFELEQSTSLPPNY